MLGGKLRNGAAQFFLLSFNFSCHMATFVKWIVYKNEKCKIVSPPILRDKQTSNNNNNNIGCHGQNFERFSFGALMFYFTISELNHLRKILYRSPLSPTAKIVFHSPHFCLDYPFVWVPPLTLFLLGINFTPFQTFSIKQKVVK